MGTRADFYVGVGPKAKWIGSIAMDGYPGGVPDDFGIAKALDENEFREAVAVMLDKTHHATKPEQGWPWPWETSATTDFAYLFDGGSVRASSFGGEFFDPCEEPEEYPDGKRDDWPDMSSKQNVTLGPRSGIIVVGT